MQVNPLEDGRHILPHRRARHLRQTVADKLRQRLQEAAPWLAPPPLDAAATREGIDLRFQFRVMFAWFTDQGPYMLPKGALRLALATHLQLPLVPDTARCRYQGRHHEAPCHQLLGRWAHHVHACGQGPRQAKHNKLRDTWAALLRRAGWHVQLEQLVTTTAGPHRADLVTIPATGMAQALDFHITAPAMPTDPTGPQLHQASLAKAARYHTTPNGLLPGDVRFIPVTYAAALPFLHVSGLRLHRVLRELAERSLTPTAAAWGAHFALVTRRETAALSHALALGAFRQHLACLGPGLL